MQVAITKRKRFASILYSLAALLLVLWFNNEELSNYLPYSTQESSGRELLALSTKGQNRQLSEDLGNGNCQWTHAQPLGHDTNAFGTLIASYPASGMRVTWQHTEGITGIQVGDDFSLGGVGATEKAGITKTQYPHLEGIWSWEDHLDQVILLVRNPRYAIPSYHNLIHEIGYAHDWEAAYEGLNKTFTARAPMDLWIKWRDYRINDEIKLWSWHIDYWMEGGTQYWMDYDFERNGQYPFKFLEEADQSNWPLDPHCVGDRDMDCVAKEIISFEKLRDDTTGPDELRKIANLLRGKQGMTVVSDEAISCVYHATIENKELPDNSNRSGQNRSRYGFTIPQMEKMQTMVTEKKAKYSSAPWDTNPQAQVLVELFTTYLVDIADYLVELNADPPPVNAYTREYHLELVSWYRSLGRGSRYNKAKVQQQPYLWREVKALYEAGEEEDESVYVD